MGVNEMNQFNDVPQWEARLISWLTVAVTVLGLLPAGLYLEDFEDISRVSQGSIWFQVQWGGVFALSIFVVLRHRALALLNLRSMNPFILTMLLYCAASTIWSPFEFVTIKKVIQFAGLIILSLAIQTDRKSWTHFIWMMVATMTAIEFASALVAITIPSFGIDAEFGYAWRGIVTGKNQLGGLSAVAALLWIALWRVRHIPKLVFWSGFGLSLMCVVMSRSSTSFIVLALGGGAYWLLHKQHIKSSLWLSQIIVGAGMILVGLLHAYFILEGHLPGLEEIAAPVAGIFGKGADLTGRAFIWEMLSVEIAKHGLLGIGYGAFWLGPGSASQPILDVMQWLPSQAHNGYLDTLNELGTVGIFLFLGLLLSHVASLARLLQVDRPAAALFGSILVIILFSNLSETSIFRGVSFFFLLMILSSVSVTSGLQRMRTQ